MINDHKKEREEDKVERKKLDEAVVTLVAQVERAEK